MICSKALDMHLGVAILRLQEGLDYSKVVASNDEVMNGKADKGVLPIPHSNSTESLPRNQSFSQMSQGTLQHVCFDFL
jgi:hypothetical protein